MAVANWQTSGLTDIQPADANKNIIPNSTGRCGTVASPWDAGHLDQITVNDDGQDLDSRFEGDTDQNLLFIDAGADRVGIGTNSPSAKLHVAGTLLVADAATFSKSVVINEDGGDNDFRVEGDTLSGLFLVDASADKVLISGNVVHTAQARFSVKQFSTDSNLPVAEWIQDDEDAIFMAFFGTSAANFTKNISTEPGDGNALPPFSKSSVGWRFVCMVKCSSTAGVGWIPMYAPDET
ncbi:MAG: hypothetical protein HRF49_07310 [bacterium]|jgi:hypothetical protein